jgi:glycosyltransferase involved in cell wall biosynthesis
MDISVVVPAYNEQKFIANTVNSIVERMPAELSYEMIVVDHGSTDETAKLAIASGAMVVDGAGLPTIAALRNLGVRRSEGDILVFIDADITLSEQWTSHFPAVVRSIGENPLQICGSHPNVPAESSLLVRYWFDPKTGENSPTHIGSCHLIITRKLFTEVGGFPEGMETSEEFLLCHNAKKLGARINARPELIITHHGAPGSLSEFMKSETWHGRGDWTSLATIGSSRVALLALVFIALHFVLLLSWLLSGYATGVALLAVVAIAGLCVASSLIKFLQHGLVYVVVNSVTFYFYFLARSASLFSALKAREFQKRTRN